jgi:uncharacterized protein DUF6894
MSPLARERPHQITRSGSCSCSAELACNLNDHVRIASNAPSVSHLWEEFAWRASMNRYFFDLVGRDRAEYDFQGRECSSLENAFQAAEFIALDLGLKSEGNWCGWIVRVRNSDGKEFFSVPVRSADLIAK